MVSWPRRKEEQPKIDVGQNVQLHHCPHIRSAPHYDRTCNFITSTIPAPWITDSIRLTPVLYSGLQILNACNLQRCHRWGRVHVAYRYCPKSRFIQIHVWCHLPLQLKQNALLCGFLFKGESAVFSYSIRDEVEGKQLVNSGVWHAAYVQYRSEEVAGALHWNEGRLKVMRRYGNFHKTQSPHTRRDTLEEGFTLLRTFPTH